MLGLQPLAHREGAARIGRPHVFGTVPAIFRSGGLPAPGRSVRRPQGRLRLHGHDRAQSAGQRQRLHEALPRHGGARALALLPLRSELVGAGVPRLQPLHLGACARLLVLQHPPLHQLGDQRARRALPQAAGDLDRGRPGLDPVPDAAPRQRIHDAAVGGADAQEEAERVHARDVLLVAADRAGEHEGAAMHLRDDGCREPAALRLRLSALGLRPAVDDLGHSVPVGEGQAQHPRRHRGAPVQAAAAK